MLWPMELVLASNNAHKAAEVRRILSGIQLRTPVDLGITFAFPEYGNSYQENAFGKARHLFELVGRPTLADDSGLEVAALGGAPGVRSARFAPPGSPIDVDDRTRNAHLLQLLQSQSDRSALFVCCVVLLLDPHRFLMVQEVVPGQITEQPQGEGGFGYDPVFRPTETGNDDPRTMAQLTGTEKDRISHRGRALRRFNPLLIQSTP